MEFRKVLHTLTPRKKYATRAVDINAVLEIIDAANHAPAPGNIQPLRFIIVEDQGRKNELAQAAQQPFIAHAPFIIVVCSDTKKMEIMYDKRADTYTRQYVGAAIQNMLLEITNLDLASYWVRAFVEEQIKDLLNIDEAITVEALISVGHISSIHRVPRRKRIALDNLVYFHEWKNKHYKKPRSAEDSSD